MVAAAPDTNLKPTSDPRPAATGSVFTKTSDLINVATLTSHHGFPINFPDERWEHIRTRPPEMDAHYDKILETLEDPDIIQAGDSGALIALKKYTDLFQVCVNS